MSTAQNSQTRVVFHVERSEILLDVRAAPLVFHVER